MATLGTVEIAEIDAFIASEKRLVDLAPSPHPTWKAGSNSRHYQASWNIEEVGRIVRSSLKFRFETGYRDHPSILLVFRAVTVWRVDLIPALQREPNPPDAHKLALPPELYGPHTHSWNDNKAFVGANGHRDIPYKRPIPAQVRKFPQAVLWLAEQVNIAIEPLQRGFDLPEQSELSLRGGRD